MTTAAPRARAAHATGARSVRGKRKHPLGWLPWVSLALLALLGALTYLVVTNVTDENDEEGIDLSDDETGTDPGGAEDRGSIQGATSDGGSAGAGAGAGGAAAGSQAGAGSSAGGGSGASAATGTLVSGSTNLLPVPAQGLAQLAGQPVSGRGVRVESVVSDEGFWVGSSARDRVFVFLTPEARNTSGESPFQVQAGQTVDLTGTVAPSADPAALGVDAAEGADQLRQQGHVIEATELALAG